jgi:hypothetical protein
MNGGIEGTEVGTSDSETDDDEFEVARQVIPKRVCFISVNDWVITYIL